MSGTTFENTKKHTHKQQHMNVKKRDSCAVLKIQHILKQNFDDDFLIACGHGGSMFMCDLDC